MNMELADHITQSSRIDLGTAKAFCNSLTQFYTIEMKSDLCFLGQLMPFAYAIYFGYNNKPRVLPIIHQQYQQIFFFANLKRIGGQLGVKRKCH